MSAPLYEALEDYAAKKYSRFHMPGHKGSPGCLPENLFRLDVTELPETDDLYVPTGCILRAEELASAYFGSAVTMFSAGGCTLAVQTMLACAASASPSDRLVVSRTAHKSVVNTMVTLDLQPIWLRTSTPDTVRTALKENPNVLGVFVTSPDYYGRLADIPGLAAVCAAYGLPLLVDNAHGSHLGAFHIHPITQGAAIVACSAHKTTPALTGGAFIHFSDARYAAAAREWMSFFGSSSPSFPILASLDLARDWLQNEGEAAYGPVAGEVAKLRELAVSLGFALPDGGAALDPARFTVNTAVRGISGHKAAQFFREHMVQPEFADDRFVIFIPTPFNAPLDFARLRETMTALSSCPPDIAPDRTAVDVGDADLPAVAMRLREAALSPRERLSPEQAAGRVSVGTICPCPPGKVVLAPGEVVEEKHCREIFKAVSFVSATATTR